MRSSANLIFLLLTYLILTSFSSFAQVRKITLLEVFTNSGCGNCANSNAVLSEFYSNFYGGVISVRYHPKFPDPRDPMYSGHSAEIDNRVNYYNILYTPQILFDGEVYGAAENVRDLWENMLQRNSRTSPIWIDVTSSISIDSAKINVKIIGYGNLTERDLKLRLAIIERNVHFDTPPGTNGETDFPDVFRRMLPDTNGTPIASIYPGDTLYYSFSIPIEDNWEWRNLAAVAWVQSDATKEIFQANTDIPTTVINSNTSNYRELSPTSENIKSYEIINFSNSSIPLKIKYTTNLFNPQWNYSLKFNGQSFDSLQIEISPNDTLSFSEIITTDNHQSVLTSTITVKNINDNFPYVYSYKNFAFYGSPDLLAINTTDTGEFSSKILPIIKDTLLLDYASFSSNQTRYWLDEINSIDFNSGLLISGNDNYSYENNDILPLINILDNGGSVLASGQRILSTRGLYQSSRNFCDNYLDIQFVERASEAEITGIVGNSLSQNLNFSLSGSYQPMPEVVSSKNGNSLPLFSLSSDTSKYVGMYHEATNYKTVYTGFGIEEIQDNLVRTEFLRRVFNWFGLYPNNIQYKEKSYEFSLHQNYPNPFNPVTTIEYSIPNVETLNATSPNVQLIVYDVLGRKVATLVNKKQSSGNYSVKFNANNLPSGIYFYRLHFDGFVATKKMILLK